MEVLITSNNKTNQYDKIAEKKAASVKKRGFGFTLFEVLYIRRDLHHLKLKDCNEMLDLLEEQKKKVLIKFLLKLEANNGCRS